MVGVWSKVVLCAALFASFSFAGVATPDSWPMFRGNPSLTGVAPGKLPKELKVAWTFKTEGPIKSSAAIVGGNVFVGSDDGHVYALDLASGKKVWAFKTGGAVESSPLVLGDKLFVGSSDAHLYALNIKDGSVAWKLQTDDKILGSPNWVKSPDGQKDWILSGSYDFRLYCVDAGTGKTNWTYETGNYINGTPAIADGRTVFGGCDALLHVIKLADGAKEKEMEAGAYIAGSGPFEKGRYYVGHYENEVLCADVNESKILWKFKDRSFPYFSSPALTPDRLVFGGRDKRLHAINRENGEAVWDFPTRGKVDSSPVVCDGQVIVGSEDGTLYIVNLADGKEVWTYEIGQAITASPAVAAGKIVIGSEDGVIYCFGAK